MTTTKALAKRSTDAVQAAPKQEMLRPIASPEQILTALDEKRTLIAKALREGVDYGRIPGTTEKQVLLKPGAESLTIAFGCRADLEVVERIVDHSFTNTWSKYGKTETATGLYRTTVRCTLSRPDGLVVGTGLGSCSSLESKYRSRPHDCENTILKMANKRAHVDAVLRAFGLSDMFTQDVEDMQQGGADEPVQRVPARNDNAPIVESLPELRQKISYHLKRLGVPQAEWDQRVKLLAPTWPGPERQLTKQEAFGVVERLKAMQPAQPDGRMTDAQAEYDAETLDPPDVGDR